MEKADDGISIGLLEEEDCDFANEVWLPNFTGPQRIYFHRMLRSWRFFVACALTHLLIIWLFSVPVDTCALLITFIISVSIHVVAVWLFLYVLCRPKEHSHLYTHWSQPHRRFIVAKDESQRGRVVGTVAIEHHTKDPSVTELFRFRVLPQCHRRGIGALLNNEAERIAKEEFGCRTMMLETVEDHASGIAFYVKNGYTLVKSYRFPNPYLDPNFVILVYEKKLQKERCEE